MAPYQSPPYLLPLSTTTEIYPPTLAALQEVEAQFDLSTTKLKEVLDQFLWEYKKGLAELPNDETRDTFT